MMFVSVLPVLNKVGNDRIMMSVSVLPVLNKAGNDRIMMFVSVSPVQNMMFVSASQVLTKLETAGYDVCQCIANVTLAMAQNSICQCISCVK